MVSLNATHSMICRCTIFQFALISGPIKIEWMKGAKLNICYNTLDRHLEKRAQQVAFYWEGNNPKDGGQITYGELHKDVCKFANALRAKGVKKVRACIYSFSLFLIN